MFRHLTDEFHLISLLRLLLRELLEPNGLSLNRLRRNSLR
jgi:hypothetical protein